MLKTYTAKKTFGSLGKNPQNYENVRYETDVYEQKPKKAADFNEAKEKVIKEHLEKRKIKWREFAEKKRTFFKKRKKQKENKETEKELWNRLSELNKELKDIKGHKKSPPKKNKTSKHST